MENDQRDFLQKVPLDSPKTFNKKALKVFEIPKNFFQKVLWWGMGQCPMKKPHE
ncbi:MAG: hypothetical protein IKM33_07445 [Clostridia bacterium]|nr:hypothetical protein [Clostridia bacterium]